MESHSLEFNANHRPVAIIGGGVLGRRLAIMYGSLGNSVHVCEISEKGAQEVREFYEANAPTQARSRKSGTGRPGQLTVSSSLKDCVRNAWLIIESIPEVLASKIELFGRLEQLCQPDAILASNSSSIKSSQMLKNVSRPDRVLSLHHFQPPLSNPVELMSSTKTDPAIIDFLLSKLGEYGFLPVLCETQSTGFIYGRLWGAIKREALRELAEGVATPAVIDVLFCEHLKSPQGPFELMDAVGLDTILKIEQLYAVERSLAGDDLQALTVLEEYVQRGALGVKTGNGFYSYSQGMRVDDRS